MYGDERVDVKIFKDVSLPAMSILTQVEVL